ncbi:gibberellin-regulated protein 4-like, partial [Trifolium medium]|nr:gibberellin-regulated protein 4-like [Trifolium medium]
MAMTKFLASLILALIAISMLQTLVMASNDSHLYDNK